MLKINNLRKTYKDLVAVSDVSFTFERGQLVGLLGPNGVSPTASSSSITAT
jgi:ABC-type Na+ transport system ATPase subunit NatA